MTVPSKDTAGSTDSAPAALSIRGLTKTFGATHALREVDLDLRQGEILALVGQNGSGKSTLIKILAGYHEPDAGRIWRQGQELALPLTSKDVSANGLVFLHQEAPVASGATALENLLVGRYPGRALRRIRWRKERTRARQMLTDIGISINLDAPAGQLPQAERALLGFASAWQELQVPGGVLVLDEPTACLAPAAAQRMFEAVRRAAHRGASVIFVSHRLDEVLNVSDRIAVLREGALIGVLDTPETDEPSLVTQMLGRPVDEFYPSAPTHVGDMGLAVSALSGAIVKDLSLQVRHGEIVGVTGLVGGGHDEVPYLIFGALPARAGKVTVAGKQVRQNPREMRRAGVALLPADRPGASGAMHATLTENVTLPTVGKFFRRGWLRSRQEEISVRSLLGRYDVRPPSPRAPLGALSGGNQQKVLLAKWLQMMPSVLMLHEPTHGVDIGSRSQIFTFIKQSALTGAAVVIASSEYEDLANLCDRVIILSRGRHVGDLAGAQLTEDRIVERCLRGA